MTAVCVWGAMCLGSLAVGRAWGGEMRSAARAAHVCVWEGAWLMAWLVAARQAPPHNLPEGGACVNQVCRV